MYECGFAFLAELNFFYLPIQELSTSVDCPDFWTFDEEKSAAKVQPYLPDYFEPKAGMPVRHKAPSLQRVVEFVEVEHRVDGFFPGGFLCPRTHVSKAHTHTPRAHRILR